MAIMTVLKKFLSVAFGIGALFFLFQNCSPVQFGASELSQIETPQSLCEVNPQLPECSQGGGQTCSFDGRVYPEGSVVKAFLSSSVPANAQCVSESRVCQGGQFTGNYQYANCGVQAPEACLFDGRTIGHGQNIRAYLQSSVSHGEACVSELRACSNGALSGSYSFVSCQVGAPQACLFNGVTVAHGASVKAYVNSTVAFGASCQEVTRTCNNGVLSGQGAYASCGVNSAASCLFNGQTIAHGGSVKSYQNASVGFGQTCVEQTRVCSNGALSGSYAYGSCTVGAASACLFNGQTLAHGRSVVAYSASAVSAGQSCISQTRTCSNGVLSGAYGFASCSVQQNASCTFNNQTVAHGQQVLAYASSSVAHGNICNAQTRTCNNGVLSGNYSFGSCSVGAASSCLFNGRTIAHGQTAVGYRSSSVSYGSSCEPQVRTCNNGTMTGSYSFGSCSADAAKSCSFNNQTVAHGSSVNAYLTASVNHGGSCQVQQRTCNNGVLSGSYAATQCSVSGPASCSYAGGYEAWGHCGVSIPATTLVHGGTRTFNSTSERGTGHVTYACNNGAISVQGTSCTEKRCETFVSPAKCNVETYCENGRFISRVGMNVPVRLAISGAINEVVASRFANITLVESGTLTRWDPLSFRCNANGWSQVDDGWCQIRKVIPNNSNYACTIDNSGGGN